MTTVQKPKAGSAVEEPKSNNKRVVLGTLLFAFFFFAFIFFVASNFDMSRGMSAVEDKGTTWQEKMNFMSIDAYGALGIAK